MVLLKNDLRFVCYKLKISKLKYGIIEIICDVYVVGLLFNKIKKFVWKIVIRNFIYF